MGLPSFSALRCHFAHALGDVSCDTTGAVDSGSLCGLPVTVGAGTVVVVCGDASCRAGSTEWLSTFAGRPAAQDSNITSRLLLGDSCLGSLYFSELPSQNGLLIP